MFPNIKLGDFLKLHFNYTSNCVELNDIYVSLNTDCNISCDIRNVDVSDSWTDYKNNLIDGLYREKNSQGIRQGRKISRESVLWNQSFWEHLYCELGKNVMNFLFVTCGLFLKHRCGALISLNEHSAVNKDLSFKRHFYTPYPKNNSLNLGYNPNLKVKHERMFYNRIVRPKSSVFSKNFCSANAVQDVLKTDVGVKFSNFRIDENLESALAVFLESNRKLSHARLKKKLLRKNGDGTVSLSSILRLVRLIILKCIPSRLLGGRQNVKALAKNIKFVVDCFWKQRITLGQLMEGLCCQNVTEWHLRSKIVLWLVENYVVELIRNSFYVTEMAKGRKMVYFLTKQWVNFEQKVLEKMLKKGKIKEIKKSNKDNTIKVKGFYRNFHKMRILRKKKGWRVLIYSVTEKPPSIKICLALLRQLIVQNNGFYFWKIHNNLNKAWVNLKKVNPGKKLFYVKSDIMDAFGSVKKALLIQILKDIFEKFVPNKMELKIFKNLCSFSTNSLFYQFSQLELTLPSRTVYEDISKRQMVSTNKITEYILNTVNSRYVKVNNMRSKTGYFQVNDGLPQGGSLSPLLCELYYGEVDKKHLIDLVKPGDLFLRAVDDYLFISSNYEHAYGFFRRMQEGFPEYGVLMQSQKMLTNVIDIRFNNEIPFFGFKLNLTDFSILPDLGIYKNSNISSTMSLSAKDKGMLMYCMSNVCTLKLYRVLLDPTYNKKVTLFKNVFYAASVMALRYSAIVKNMLSSLCENDDDCLFSCVKLAVSKVSIKSAKLSTLEGNTSVIELNTARYLALRAFILVMRRDRMHFPVETKVRLLASRIFKKMRAREKQLAKKVSGVLPDELKNCS